MTDDEIIAVVQAHKEGKKIQWMTRIGPQTWHDYLGSPIRWNFDRYDYRVVPEPRNPREWSIGVHGDRVVGGISTDDKKRVMYCGSLSVETVHVREVIN